MGGKSYNEQITKEDLKIKNPIRKLIKGNDYNFRNQKERRKWLRPFFCDYVREKKINSDETIFVWWTSIKISEVLFEYVPKNKINVIPHTLFIFLFTIVFI